MLTALVLLLVFRHVILTPQRYMQLVLLNVAKMQNEVVEAKTK